VADFSNITVSPVTEFRNGKAVLSNQYEATAQPSGIVFRFILAPAISTPAIVGGEAEQWAEAFNRKVDVSGVQSISTYSDVTAQNQIQERLTVVVESDSCESTKVLDMPQSLLQQVTFNQRVEKAREELNAIEALASA
jgi:post-segregation antitoxin (ccd killing protein)